MKSVRNTLQGLSAEAALPPLRASIDPRSSAAPGHAAATAPTPEDGRKNGVYTFLAVGKDQVALNTDTIMAGRLDTSEGRLDIVSIPRDTLANVKWGVKRINVSLDSLRPERIDAIASRQGVHADIFEGLAAAERVGFSPIKINTVVMRGRNDDELVDFARATLERPWHVRFIEVMPVGANLDISMEEYIPAFEILDRVRAIGDLEPVEGPIGNGPARYFRFPGAAGTVGVITPMSHNYCDRCNRMRLTADGQLRPCLFGSIQTDLRGPPAGRAARAVYARRSRSNPRDTTVQGSAVAPAACRPLAGRRLTGRVDSSTALPYFAALRVHPKIFETPRWR